jgi:threonine/homoserine/homoserine lactone efflux protein
VISGERTLAFVIACVAIILAPGPSVMFVVARAVAWGRATAWLTALGNAFGMLALSVVIALGLGPLFQRSALLLTIVQGLGGLYLIWLGIDALRHRRAHVDAMVTVDEEKPSLWQVIRQGFVVGILNPKALVFFSAVFPQFVEPASGSVTVQLLIFGLIFAVLSVLLDGMWAIVVGSSRDWFVTSDNRLLVLRTVGGVVMVVLGVLVLIPLLWSLMSGA